MHEVHFKIAKQSFQDGLPSFQARSAFQAKLCFATNSVAESKLFFISFIKLFTFYEKCDKM